MKSRRKMVITSTLLLMLLLSQCNLPARESDDYSTRIISPHAGEIITVREVVEIYGHLTDSQEGNFERNNHMTIYANGNLIGEQTMSTDSPLTFGMTVEWIPDEPGEYFLQFMSTRRGKWAVSDSVRVCVLEFSLDSPELVAGEHDLYRGTHGYEGECDIPERSAGASPGRLTFSADATPDHLTYYFPSYLTPDGSQAWTGDIPEACGDTSSTIAYLATVEDPNDDVVFVKVDISYSHNSIWHTRFLESSTLILNRLGGHVLSPKLFGGSYPDSQVLYYPEYLGETFEVIWTAYAIGRSGEVLASDGPNSIPVELCTEEMVPLNTVIPTEPPPTQPPELIPSIENCPPGTYYAPATNRCIAIQVPDDDGRNNDGDNNDRGGGCNLSISACSDQGMSFDSNNCQCVPIQ